MQQYSFLKKYKSVYLKDNIFLYGWSTIYACLRISLQDGRTYTAAFYESGHMLLPHFTTPAYYIVYHLLRQSMHHQSQKPRLPCVLQVALNTSICKILIITINYRCSTTAELLPNLLKKNAFCNTLWLPLGYFYLKHHL